MDLWICPCDYINIDARIVLIAFAFTHLWPKRYPITNLMNDLWLFLCGFKTKMPKWIMCLRNASIINFQNVLLDIQIYRIQSTSVVFFFSRVSLCQNRWNAVFLCVMQSENACTKFIACEAITRLSFQILSLQITLTVDIPSNLNPFYSCKLS